MPPLNPFLRAFFRSTLPAQCSPVQNHALLVPTTELLLTHRDRETHAVYSDLVNSEEFLASHVLRVPAAVSSAAPAGAQPTNKDVGTDPVVTAAANSFRESRAKAKQFTTLNGRTVIVKDTYLYSNKGFKNLNQAQLLGDAIYYPDSPDAHPWLVYYISKPLIGTCEAIKIPRATLNKVPADKPTVAPHSPSSSTAKKKDIKSFSDILNGFPMIARQMQPGLERIFKEFKREIEKPLPALPTTEPASSRLLRRRQNSISSLSSLSNSLHSNVTNGQYRTSLEMSAEEEDLRHSLEIAVTAAIDLFQMVDKQQLSNLGSETDLTGAAVERMIEKYVTEQLHDSMLFQRICAVRKAEDVDLESRVRQMIDIDIAQVGLSSDTGKAGKREMAHRLASGVDAFKKMGVATSPQEMLEILLETQKTITKTNGTTTNGVSAESEKSDPIMTINADTLVSLLLIVVIRSPVRYLQARLSYMRHFIFIDDVESGEVGYALSTFEAVLSYLSIDSGGLRRSSLRNRRLWQATKNGDIGDMRAILEPEDTGLDFDDGIIEPRSASRRPSLSPADEDAPEANDEDAAAVYDMMKQANGSLQHVFPFQRPETPRPHFMEPEFGVARKKKRVSVQSRSTSSSSGYSVKSLPLTIGSHFSGFEGDLSIETLVQTQGPHGDSVLMMAVVHGQDRALQYLLSLHQYFPIQIVLEDETNDGTTLLSAAVQTGNRLITDLILDYIIDNAIEDDAVRIYLERRDSNGRSATHYLFDYPSLIPRIGHLVPWTLKDKNGQTPLFALCRSYDHEEYRWMVETGLSAAAKAQQTDKSVPMSPQRLRLDDHVDNKGNTLLHIVNDPGLATKLLRHCDSDVNAQNEKQFTPLMVASKYGRTDLARVFFGDPRTDLYARDIRGLTATELAKDDDVRNRIDDMILLASPPDGDTRVTTVVRSFFVDDGTVRFIVKSAAKNAVNPLPNGTSKPKGPETLVITTTRRTITEFEKLARHLALEHPASWLPHPSTMLSPFLIPSKPARSVARDLQLRLDAFLKTLLSHPTFAQHEMVWEFFLVPEMADSVLEERANRKAELRVEMVKDEFLPVTDVRDVELFVSYAKDSVRGVAAATKSVLRRTNALRLAQNDMHDASTIAANAVATLEALPASHIDALRNAAAALKQLEYSPATQFFYDTASISMTISALLRALARPSDQASKITATRKTLERATATLRRSTSSSIRSPLSNLNPLSLPPLTAESRKRAVLEAMRNVQKLEDDVDLLGRELAYTRQVVAQELAAWQEGRVKAGREACRTLAKRMVVVERARLESLRRAVRGVGVGVEADPSAVPESSADERQQQPKTRFRFRGRKPFGELFGENNGESSSSLSGALSASSSMV